MYQPFQACANKAETPNMEDLVPKKNCNAAVWQYFGFKGDENGQPVDLNEAICRMCRRRVLTKQGNTTNLRSHLKAHHSEEFAQLHDSAADESIQRMGSHQHTTGAFANTKLARNSFRWNEITTAVTRYLVKGMLPFHTVEKRSFRDMISALDRQYELPSRKYFSKTAVPDLYKKVREEVGLVLGKAEFFSLTVDLWSSVDRTRNMSVMAHFITPEWTWQSMCLDTSLFPESRTAENLAESFRAVLEEWRLSESKLTCITSDDAANIKSTVTDVLGRQWLGCFGHNLNLAATNFLKSPRQRRIERVLGICRSLVATFSNNSQKKWALLKAQQDLTLPVHSLMTDCTTYWGSQQKMIDRVLEQAPAIMRVLAEDRHTDPLSWQDVEVLEAINKALKPIAELTDILLEEDYVTLSSLLPMLQLLHNDTLKKSEEDVPLTKDIKRAVLTELESKYDCESTKELMRAATFLDPRFRGEHFDSDMLAETKAGLKKEIIMLEQQSQIVWVKEEENEEVQMEVQGPRAKRRSLGSVLSKAPLIPVPASIEERADAELTSYGQEHVIQGEADPFAWWSSNEGRFPFLAKIARKYLCVCATSIPSKRVFSSSGNIVAPLCSNLKPDKVNMLVFLAKNA
ncbi:hypothetical protein GJAV_G00154450 [Gymnothorax javanicus]|nr:hypothetical protein GJAV_G00154450 [Gymnothorax javanicus]